MNLLPSSIAQRVRRLLGVILILLDGLVLVTLLIIPIAWLLDPLLVFLGPIHLTVHWGLKPLLAPVVLLLMHGVIKSLGGRIAGPVRGLWETAGFKKLVLALVSTYLLFAAMETMLIWTHFDAALPPIMFQGQNTAGGIKVPKTTPDAALMYRLTPGTYFQGRLINSLGFREREVDLKKSPDTMRVICMGDSITGQGRPGYSQYLHKRLTNAPPTSQPWEAFNIGVHGYSVLQGLRQFQILGRQMEPDIVTIYFGWNDHWLAAEADRQKMGLEMRPFAGRIFEVLRKKRFFRFFIWAMSPVQHLARRDQGETRVLRVPPEAYRSAMKALVKEIRAVGAIPILITAPRRSLTQAVVYKQYVTSIDDGNRLHDRYVDTTRKVARDTQAELLDLAMLLADQECDAYFAPDGIHFDAYTHEGHMASDPPTQPGLMRIAEEIDKQVRAVVHSQAWQKLHPTTK